MLWRSLLSFRIALSINPPKSILLSHASPLSKYTFLAIRTQSLTSSVHQLADILACPELETFLHKVKSQLPVLVKVSRQNYGFKQLHKIEEEGGLSQILSTHSTDIKACAQSYAELMQAIKQSVNALNYMSWMEMCLRLNIIEIGVWKGLLKACWEGHRSRSPTDQDHTMLLVHTYLTQKFMKFTHRPDKYLYRQNAIVDLGSLPELIFLFMDCLISRPNINNHACSSFRMMVELNSKLAKTTLVNFMGYIRHYKQNQDGYQRIIDVADVNTLIEFLRFFALIGYADKALLGSIELKIVRMLQESNKLLDIDQAASVIDSWGLLSHFSQETYQLQIKPTLLKFLKRGSGFSKLTIILFNLIAAGVDDIDLFQAIIAKIVQEHPIDNKVMHVINHYLSVHYKINRLSSYPHCQPNIVAQDLVAQCITVYSNCLQRNTKIDPKKTHKDLGYTRQLGIEHNPPQSFWLLILEEAFKQLSKKYPHEKNAVYFNFSFCVFELDALVVLNQTYIAFELIGTHYMHKDLDNSSVSGSCQGKKNIRSSIIKAYGIKVCEINSAGLVERTISSFQDRKNGVKFISQKLEAAYHGEC